MSSRRPAESHFSGRPSGSLARSPAERLEPTRPFARQRRQRFARESGSSRPLIRWISGVFTLLLLVMLLAVGAAVFLQSRIQAPGPLASAKSVTIPKGDSAHEIAARLEREGFVSDRRLFIAAYLMARALGRGEGGRSVQLKAGDYMIPQAASVRHILDVIVEGRAMTYKVTIPEGLTSEQVAARLMADSNLMGELAEVPPEGSLLPETFIVQRGAARQSVIDRMRGDAQKLAETLWSRREKDLPLASWQEVVTLASIVEKETGRNDERARVAAVFINRLRQKMRLQSDPTIVYGISGGKAVWNRPILRSEIARKTSHNTYQIDGLPPTPICNPGRATIEAVLNPADTKDLYFVADGSGGHVFSETLKEHNANVQKWRAVERDMKAKPNAAPSPGDTPTTAQPKTRPAVRRPPPKNGKATQGNETGANKEDQGWTSTTQPAARQSK